MDNILNSVNRVVTKGMNETLTQPYTEDEVRQALFQMHPSKTPELDGMSPFFFLRNTGILLGLMLPLLFYQSYT